MSVRRIAVFANASPRISGKVAADEKLVLEAKSIMQGDIRAAKLVVDEGAIFDGKCEMKQSSATPVSSPKKD